MKYLSERYNCTLDVDNDRVVDVKTSTDFKGIVRLDADGFTHNPSQLRPCGFASPARRNVE